MKIITGMIKRPVKLVVYGPEGIGKSTLAAGAPDPLFIDTEGGTSYMDVKRVQAPGTWEQLLNVVKEVALDPSVCSTLVIDTADWAEQLCVNSILNEHGKKGIEDFGYGKGYAYIAEEFAKLLNALDSVIQAGVNVVVTAHAKMRKFEQPDEMGAYDRWEMKLSKQAAPLLKEWCDALLFLNYKTIVVKGENNTLKARGGKRMIFATHNPCWDAKNRHGLPDECELSFANIEKLFPGAEDPMMKLVNTMIAAGVKVTVHNEDGIEALDADGNPHMFQHKTGTIILKDPTSARTIVKEGQNVNVFIKAMKVKNLVNKYFKEI